ncbi:MAG: DUF1365 domain-containing protein [Wenzhouxiangellaceae bacterium]
MPLLHNAIARGRMQHRRHFPRPHQFSYALYQTLCDVDELPQLLGSRWWQLLRYRRQDFLLSSITADRQPDLATAVRDCVAAGLGRRPAGRVFVLTHVRQWGYCFNPVSFYFCCRSSGELDAIVAEIHNTPWGERHRYVFDAPAVATADGVYQVCFAKQFHVSPFLGMDHRYRWRFVLQPDSLRVFMAVEGEQGRVFDAALTLRYSALTRQRLRLMAWRYPLMCQRVSAAIYWQAFRLWLKKTPFFPHPDKARRHHLN